MTTRYDTIEELIETLTNIHDPSVCQGRPCPIHNPSDHHMRDWPVEWCSLQTTGHLSKGHIERICPHGVGHPDPDQPLEVSTSTAHGCDGCCVEK